MTKVILYGHLAKQFGKLHHFNVRSPREAVAALMANFPGFKGHVLKHNEPGYHVRVGREFRDEEGLVYPADDVVRIIPAVSGASGAGKILLGAALIFAAFALPGSTFLLGALGEGGLMALAGATKSMGMAMVLGGVAQVLFPMPKMGSSEPTESTPSYNFNGPVNTVTQGNPVPICYGELIVGGQVISALIDTGDIAI